jgi:hypothetical protein
VTTGSLAGALVDRLEPLSAGERWMADARDVFGIRGGMVQCFVDMTQAKAAVQALRDGGLSATFVHVVVRASALALARTPGLYQTVYGYRRVSSERVDIGLSTGSLATDLPIILADVGRTPLARLGEAIDQATAKAQASEARFRRDGWLTPFGFLRRWLLRRWSRTLSARRRIVGTFEVNCDSNADIVVPLRFYSDAVLSAGRVNDVVVDIDGQPAIRPMAWLSLCVDHVAMDGVRGAALINAIKAILEGDELLDEARGALGASE